MGGSVLEKQDLQKQYPVAPKGGTTDRGLRGPEAYHATTMICFARVSPGTSAWPSVRVSSVSVRLSTFFSGPPGLVSTESNMNKLQLANFVHILLEFHMPFTVLPSSNPARFCATTVLGKSVCSVVVLRGMPVSKFRMQSARFCATTVLFRVLSQK